MADASLDAIGNNLTSVPAAPFVVANASDYVLDAASNRRQTTVAGITVGYGLNQGAPTQDLAMNQYYHHDSLGSVVAVTDVNGVVKESYRYTAFGKPTVFDRNGAEVAETQVEQPFMWTGARHDFEEGSGLYQMRLRYYDPAGGRFVSRDPLGLWGDPSQAGNGQGYCGHNPVNRVDPLALAEDDFPDLFAESMDIIDKHQRAKQAARENPDLSEKQKAEKIERIEADERAMLSRAKKKWKRRGGDDDGQAGNPATDPSPFTPPPTDWDLHKKRTDAEAPGKTTPGIPDDVKRQCDEMPDDIDIGDETQAPGPASDVTGETLPGWSVPPVAPPPGHSETPHYGGPVAGGSQVGHSELSSASGRRFTQRRLGGMPGRSTLGTSTGGTKTVVVQGGSTTGSTLGTIFGGGSRRRGGSRVGAGGAGGGGALGVGLGPDQDPSTPN